MPTSRKVWLMPTTWVLCSNAANTGECKTWTQSEVCTWQNSVRGQQPPKMYIWCTSPGDGQRSCTVWLASGERRRCSNEANMRNPLQFAGVPKHPKVKRCQPLVGRSSPYCEDMWRTYCCLTSFFPTVNTCRSWEDTAWQSCAMVHKLRFFCIVLASCISSEPRAARFRPTF